MIRTCHSVHFIMDAGKSHCLSLLSLSTCDVSCANSSQYTNSQQEFYKRQMKSIIVIVRCSWKTANLKVHCSDCPANISETCKQKDTHIIINIKQNSTFIVQCCVVKLCTGCPCIVIMCERNVYFGRYDSHLFLCRARDNVLVLSWVVLLDQLLQTLKRFQNVSLGGW